MGLVFGKATVQEDEPVEPFVPSCASKAPGKITRVQSSRPALLPATRSSTKVVVVVAEDENTADDLQKFYDMRTWAMFRRITQARQKQQAARQQAAAAATSDHVQHAAAVVWIPAMHAAAATDDGSYGYIFSPPEPVQEPSQSSFLEDTSSDHEMIFGDLE